MGGGGDGATGEGDGGGLYSRRYEHKPDAIALGEALTTITLRAVEEFRTGQGGPW